LYWNIGRHLAEVAIHTKGHLDWASNVLLVESACPKLDPSSSGNKIPDYAVRLDPACQLKAIGKGNPVSIQICPILDDPKETSTRIEIPPFDSVKAGIGDLIDFMMHRQLTGDDIGALSIIYIASDGLHKARVPNCQQWQANSVLPRNRYVMFHAAKHILA
jgi:hypothetical protein